MESNPGTWLYITQKSSNRSSFYTQNLFPLVYGLKQRINAYCTQKFHQLKKLFYFPPEHSPQCSPNISFIHLRFELTFGYLITENILIFFLFEIFQFQKIISISWKKFLLNHSLFVLIANCYFKTGYCLCRCYHSSKKKVRLFNGENY